MRREWLFSARLAAWRNGCARAEGPRLLTDVTGVFVDRKPIDWRALLARVHASPDRAFVENLYLLDRIRHPASPVPRVRERDGTPLLFLWLLITLAALQTACCLAAVGIAFVTNGATTFRAPQIALALAFGAAGVLLGTATPRDARSLSLLAAFAAVAGAFARAAAAGLPDTYTVPIAPVLRGMYPEAFTPAFLWQFALHFPRVRRFTSFDVLARRMTAVAWLLGLLLFAVNLIAAYGIVESDTVVYLLRNHPSNGFWNLFALAVLPALATIVVRSRRATPAERRNVVRFAAAAAVGTAPLLLSGVLRMLLPPFDEWLLNAGPGDRAWLDRLVMTALMATPILGAITLVVDRPFELRAISRVRLARWAVSVAVLAPFVALALTLYGLRHLALAEVFSGPRAWWLIASGIAGCALFLARSTLLDALDRRGFVRGVDDHERLLGALERVRNARGSREISVALTRELRRGLGAPVHVLVPGAAGAFMDASTEVTPLGSDAVLIAMLHETKRPLDFSPDRPLRLLLPQKDRAWLATNDVELAAALKHRDGALAGIVTLGRKRGATPFSRRDRWLVTTLTTAGAAAWDADSGESRDEAAFECPRCGLVEESTRLPCGCRQEAVLASLPRHVAGKFVVERRIGAGGMGIVYVARDTALDREVALKTLPDVQEGTVARLRDEARAMAALNHEGVATLYGLELWRRTPVLVVEYFPDGTLAQRLARGPFSPAAVVAFGIALARALTYMHGNGVLHRDLKPSNIALTASGGPKLLDFGLVNASAGFAGTPAYMPPEAFEGAPPTAAFDLWALSIVLLEALRGRQQSVPSAVGAFFDRALARRPELRFQTAAEFLAALEALYRDLTAGSATPSSSFP